MRAGDKIERITLLERVVVRKRGHWLSRCDCGKQWMCREDGIKAGVVKSCGCLKNEIAAALKTKHSMHLTREYKSWNGMIQRCSNPRATGFANYGGRGIKVCDAWRSSFEAFYADMGPRPDGMTLDRIDGDGNYEPGNCHWATRAEQTVGRRPTKWVRLRGRLMPLAYASTELGMSPSGIYHHIYSRDVTPQEAVDFYAARAAA
jgi:hypothetical protein